MFAYMQYGQNVPKSYLDQIPMEHDYGFQRTFEYDIRMANIKYQKIVIENEIFRKRATGPEKIAVAREFVSSVLEDYSTHLVTTSLLRKQITESCYIKGTDVYWVHGCIEAAHSYWNEHLKNKK